MLQLIVSLVSSPSVQRARVCTPEAEAKDHQVDSYRQVGYHQLLCAIKAIIVVQPCGRCIDSCKPVVLHQQERPVSVNGC